MSDVLVLRALGIGDLLVSVPALRGLRRAYPTARLVLAAPNWLAPLVALTGCVDTLLPTPGLGALRWPGSGPALAVNLHGKGPESTADLAATHPGTLLTHGDGLGPDWVEDMHEAHRWCRLLAWQGIESAPTDLAIARPDRPAPATTVLHPGAKDVARRWPPDRFAEVARHLAGHGHDVVLTGSAAERELALSVAQEAGLPESAVLAGRLDLTELAALVAAATLVVSNDTGVAHLATAYGTPSVVLFGPQPPARWGPPQNGHHIALWTGDLHDLTPETVIAAATVHSGAR